MIKQLSNVDAIYHNGKEITKIVRGDGLVLYGKKEYSINLGGWVKSGTAPGGADGIYQSNSNYHKHSQNAYIYITIKGYDSFTIYVRSYGEKNYDYVTVGKLDQTPTRTSSTSGSVYYSFYGKASSSTYTPITFNNIGGGEHTITVMYGKDSSANSGADRGYLYIPQQ